MIKIISPLYISRAEMIFLWDFNGNITIKTVKKFLKLNLLWIDNRLIAEFEVVETISLATILNNIEHVDLLKLDCEGGEYDIFTNSSRDVLDKMDNIWMEYHLGRGAEIESILSHSGFIQHHLVEDTDVSGNMWFRKVR